MAYIGNTLSPGYSETAGAEILSTNQTLASGTSYIINSASNLTMTLPASPEIGDTILLSNQGTGTVTVARNGKNITSLAENGTLNADSSTQLVYVNTTIGWAEL
jgi:hypothetical protein